MSSAAAGTLTFCKLPSEVLASVLSGFSQGKAISTFLFVARGNATLKQSALSLCRGALVHRYIELCRRFRRRRKGAEDDDDEQDSTEIPDVLDMIREDIRLSDDTDDAIITKFSEWCAILDYFEAQLSVFGVKGYKYPQWVVWSGQIEIPYGVIQAFLTTPHWTAGAMHSWRSMELASSLSVNHPRTSDFHFTAERIPYGSLFGMHTMDRRRLGIQSTDIEVTVLHEYVEARRYALTPISEGYEENPSVVFVDHSFVCRTHGSVPVGPLLIAPGKASLCCCWDNEHGEDDWEEAMSCLGKHAIRIMNSFVGVDGRGPNALFSEALTEQYSGITEFSNLV